MKRRDWLKYMGLTTAGLSIAGKSVANTMSEYQDKFPFSKSDFGPDFKWGAACAAYQVEGAWNTDGKGPSIWDTFTHKKGNVHGFQNADVAVDFYHRYKEDIQLAKDMNLQVFRFSISWSRIFPTGEGDINQKGVDFYHNVIDFCLEIGIEPWITLYHWDLPQALEDKGGWTNREILTWFSDYTTLCAKEFGPKVKNWMVMNEPAAFVGLGYMLGYHAPGKKGAMKFLKATHHTCLSMANGGRILREIVTDANIGTTFSCSNIEPYNDSKKELNAAVRIDALINRLYVEPCLGLGYPVDGIPALKKIEKFMEPGDDELLKFDFDFIGLQNYFRIISKKSLFPPFLWAKQIPATKRDVPLNEMDFEVYPEGMYKILKQFGEYPQIKKIIVTENGVCYEDHVIDGKVHDEQRIQFFKDYIGNLLKAKKEGVPVDGYFLWSLTDNFEWSEGYEPRFGIIYVDVETQKRTVKDSGYWFQELLR